jgi:SagB-type dehydrogenase family enzyme
MQGSGTTFQEQTKYTPEEIRGRTLDWDNKPPVFKRYEAARRVKLPTPHLENGVPLWHALQTRRSIRSFQNSAISMKTLAGLLWASQGVTGISGNTLFRTAPSAGGLFPVETYLVVNRVADLQEGLYHFFLPEWELEFLSAGKLGPGLAHAALGQTIMAESAVNFIWTAVIKRSAWKYRQRAYRYIYLDAGHICQNLYLACESLGLGCCAVGAFFDDEANQLLGVEGNEETVIYMAATGRKQPPKEG